MPVVSASGIQPGMATMVWWLRYIVFCTVSLNLICYVCFLQWHQVSLLLNLSTEMYLCREYTFAFTELFSLWLTHLGASSRYPRKLVYFFSCLLACLFCWTKACSKFPIIFFPSGTKAQKIFTLSEFWWHLMLRRWCFCSFYSGSYKLAMNVLFGGL